MRSQARAMAWLASSLAMAVSAPSPDKFENAAAPGLLDALHPPTRWIDGGTPGHTGDTPVVTQGLDTIAEVLQFRGTQDCSLTPGKCESQKRAQASEFAELAAAAYSGHPAGESHRAEKMNAPSVQAHPWQALKQFYPRTSPVIPMLQQQHHWHARAYESNRRRSAKLSAHPLTNKHFEFWTQEKKAKADAAKKEV